MAAASGARAGLAFDLATVLSLGDRLPLLELPLAPAQPELDLRQAVREVHAAST